MTDKIQRTLIILCLCLCFVIIVFCDTQERHQLTNVQEELSSINQENKELNAQLINLQGDLSFANAMIKDLKSDTYKYVYLGNFKYTYYCNEPRKHICGMGLGLTASGVPTEVGKTIAVDPTVIPLGTTVYIEGIGFRVAQDTGSGVKGNHIDILVNGHNEALSQTLVEGGVWVLIDKS